MSGAGQLCRFWPNNCKNGDRCRWAHGPQDLRSDVSSYPAASADEEAVGRGGKREPTAVALPPKLKGGAENVEGSSRYYSLFGADGRPSESSGRLPPLLSEQSGHTAEKVPAVASLTDWMTSLSLQWAPHGI